jgi:hypothetical protein
MSLNRPSRQVKLNLGLCYLLKGDQETAANYYVDAITDLKKLSNTLAIQKHLQAGINDINDALAKTPNIKGSDYIKELLEQELYKLRKTP